MHGENETDRAEKRKRWEEVRGGLWERKESDRERKTERERERERESHIHDRIERLGPDVPYALS